MNTDDMMVFFYGLFMDEKVLAAKGIYPKEVSTGYVEGYGLHIGERATLLPEANARAYGLLMQLGADDVVALYAEASVADYKANAITVILPSGARQQATCYNLPRAILSGVNPEYAQTLLKLAMRLGFPAPYLAQIREAANPLL